MNPAQSGCQTGLMVHHNELPLRRLWLVITTQSSVSEVSKFACEGAATVQWDGTPPPKTDRNLINCLQDL